MRAGGGKRRHLHFNSPAAGGGRKCPRPSRWRAGGSSGPPVAASRRPSAAVGSEETWRGAHAGAQGPADGPIGTRAAARLRLLKQRLIHTRGDGGGSVRFADTSTRTPTRKNAEPRTPDPTRPARGFACSGLSPGPAPVADVPLRVRWPPLAPASPRRLPPSRRYRTGSDPPPSLPRLGSARLLTQRPCCWVRRGEITPPNAGRRCAGTSRPRPGHGQPPPPPPPAIARVPPSNRRSPPPRGRRAGRGCCDGGATQTHRPAAPSETRKNASFSDAAGGPKAAASTLLPRRRPICSVRPARGASAGPKKPRTDCE